jgi:hypothetical protein
LTDQQRLLNYADPPFQGDVVPPVKEETSAIGCLVMMAFGIFIAGPLLLGIVILLVAVYAHF